jgi:hypothetical protein
MRAQAEWSVVRDTKLRLVYNSTNGSATFAGFLSFRPVLSLRARADSCRDYAKIPAPVFPGRESAGKSSRRFVPGRHTNLGDYSGGRACNHLG